MSGLRDRYWAGVLLMSVALSAHGADRTPAKPATKGPAPDLDFLEYLGTLESDEENWTDVVNMELPNDTKAKSTRSTAKGKSKAEVAAKSAGGEK